MLFPVRSNRLPHGERMAQVKTTADKRQKKSQPTLEIKPLSEPSATWQLGGFCFSFQESGAAKLKPAKPIENKLDVSTPPVFWQRLRWGGLALGGPGVRSKLCIPRPSWDCWEAEPSSRMEGGLKGMQLLCLFARDSSGSPEKQWRLTGCLEKLCLVQAASLPSGWDSLCQPERRKPFYVSSQFRIT